MNKSTIEAGQPGQQNNSEQTAQNQQVSQPNANTNVMRRCPFCGNDAILIKRGNAFTKKRSAEIECMNCHVKMIVGAIRNTLEWCEKKVIEKWNSRSNGT